MPEKNIPDSQTDEKKALLAGKINVPISGYIALIVAIIFFSGLLMNIAGMKWISAFDFTSLIGAFGTMKEPAKNSFVGDGGYSARAGFLFALSLIPTTMLALGFLEILTSYGAMKAGQRLLSPILKPLLGIPGFTGLTLITDLQSTDAGAALTKELYDDELITKKELIIMGSWQFSGAGAINNYFSIGSALFAFLTVPLIVPLFIIIIMKFVGAFFIRILLNTVYKEDFKHE